MTQVEHEVLWIIWLLKASICRSQLISRFELAQIWSISFCSATASFGSVNQASL